MSPEPERGMTSRRRSAPRSRARAALLASASSTVLSLASAHAPAVEVGTAQANTPPEPSREQVEAYLDSHALPKSPHQTGADEGTYQEVPPLPPRHHGLVVEASPGVLFQLGALRHISPPSPWLQVDVGYELWTWLMVLAHADFTVASTSYAAQPPPPRTFAQYAFGAGARLQVPLGETFAAHAQFELGLSEVTEDVLGVYGFAEADELGLYYGGRLGLEWLQTNPHLAVGAHATLRSYSNLERTNYGDAPLGLIGALTLRYAF
jgi:hypothetical protein